MSNFNRIYKSILVEGRVPSIFRKATPEELAERRKIYSKIKFDEWFESFRELPHVSKNRDGSWNVQHSVSLSNMSLMEIPIKFNFIGGSFSCYSNHLTTLKNCPRIVNGRFDCSSNKLTSLEHCPQSMLGSFICHSNFLTSLEHCPRNISGNFDCSSNKLTSLDHCPEEVVRAFDCSMNPGKFSDADVRNRCNVAGKIYT